MNAFQEHVDENREETLAELIELLQIPSISTDESRKADMLRCARRVADRMGVSERTVYRKIKRLGLNGKHRPEVPGKP